MKTEEILTQIIQYATNVQNFVLEQAPDVIRQLLMFNFAEAVILIAIILGSITLLNFLVVKFFGVIMEFCEELIAIPVMLIIAANAGLFCALHHQLMIALKIGMAPKLYLIEYAARLIK